LSDIKFSAHQTEAGDFERVVLVHQAPRASSEDMDELDGLARAAGGVVIERLVSTRSHPVAATLLGRGKIQELHEIVESNDITLVIVDQDLTPIQERNLERGLECRVIDRTRLILDIFALRATTSEGKFQVELAQLRHMSTRLVRGWTHLERQKGGIGLRGPGETQLESDRRMLGNRIRTLKNRLDKVESQRQLRRRGRNRTPIPTVSFVGYTNAGKSTLFNTLTGANVYAKDELFATLDPTMRRYQAGTGDPVVLSDTVGFISRLPHNLVKAFHSTLEEVIDATLLLHVIDISDVDWRDRKADVEAVLADIGADEIPRFEIYNKCDQAGLSPERSAGSEAIPEKLVVSAVSGEGIDLLEEALADYFSRHREHRKIFLPSDAGRLRAQIYDHCQVLSEIVDDTGVIVLELDLGPRESGWLQSHEDFKPAYFNETEDFCIKNSQIS